MSNKNNQITLTQKTGGSFTSVLLDNAVTILFITLCISGLVVAKQPLSFVLDQISTRFFRNIILVFSLLVPVWAGMGLNFSIVLGAMAAQIGFIVTMNYSISGMLGILVAFLVMVPLAIVLGTLTGCLFNKTKGHEMITGMILAYFAKGVYELIVMYFCGPLIPISNKTILLPNGIGINGTLTLGDGLNGAIDKIYKMSMDKLLIVALGILVAVEVIKLIVQASRKEAVTKNDKITLLLSVVLLAAYLGAIKLIPALQALFAYVTIPVGTLALAAIVGYGIYFFDRTKYGCDMRSVGQSRYIATASGINVDKMRIIATVISTVLAGLGQMVYLQNIATFATYSSHDQIGTFSIAALLVGGASIKKANIKQAILGALLFHTMFIIAPIAGKNLFNEAQIGEYFRVFASYAVIAIALALHAWKSSILEREAKMEGF